MPTPGSEHESRYAQRADPAGASAWIMDPTHAVARRRPDEPAIVFSDGVVTWAELDARADHASGLLDEAGLSPGDVLGFQLSNPLQSVVLVLACLRAGVVAAPLSTRLPEAGVQAACRTLGTSALVAEGHGLIDPERLLAAGGTRTVAGRSVVTESRRVTAVFTSGSMGEPTAVVHGLGAHRASAEGVARTLRFGPEDRWLLSLPVFHVGGLAVIFRALHSGGAIVIPDAGADPMEQTRRFGVTHLSMVATQLARGLERAAPPPESMKCALLGGGPLPAELLAEAAARGWPVCASYGLTETASLVTSTRPGEAATRLSTAGRVMPGRQIRIGPEGRILVSGPILFDGMLRSGTFEPARLDDGWYDTGDLGEIDPDGCLRVLGRADNRFVSGGENIQPEAIERVLRSVPGVVDAIVVPVPDVVYGARPFAWIDGPLDPGAFEEAVRSRLPGFMVPVAFHGWPPSLRQTGIKPSRRVLTRLAADEIRREGDLRVDGELP